MIVLIMLRWLNPHLLHTFPDKPVDFTLKMQRNSESCAFQSAVPLQLTVRDLLWKAPIAKRSKAVEKVDAITGCRLKYSSSSISSGISFKIGAILLLFINNLLDQSGYT